MLSLGERLSLGMQRKSGERRAWLHWQCQKALGGFPWPLSLAFEDSLHLKLLKAVLTGTSPSAFPKTCLHKPSFPLVVEAMSYLYAFPPCGRGCCSHWMSPFPRSPAWGPFGLSPSAVMVSGPHVQLGPITASGRGFCLGLVY